MTENVVNYELSQNADKWDKFVEDKKVEQGWEEGALRLPSNAFVQNERMKAEGRVQPVPQQEQEPYNWNRLTDTEKRIYSNGLASVLPTPIQAPAEWILNKLETLNNSWVGRVLPVFDILAEGVERGFGMAAQYKDAAERGPQALEDYWGQLGAAWKAGSFYYNVANIIAPSTSAPGKITIRNDMPGYTELYNIRQKVLSGQTLPEIEAELYADMGALRVRSVLQDAIGHIALDPMNLILPKIIKFPTRIQLKRGELLYKIGKVGDDAIDAYRVAADTAHEAAVVGKAAENAADLYTDAVRAIEELAEVEGKAFTPWERFVVGISGGMPVTGEAALELVQNAPKGIQKLYPWNLFRITRESRAAEVLQNVSIQTQTLIAHTDDPLEAANIIKRAVSASSGEKFGHVIASPQGRAALSWLKGVEPQIDDMIRMMESSSDNRALIQAISEVVGESTNEVMRLMQNGSEETLLQRIVASLDGGVLPQLEQQALMLTDMRNAGSLNPSLMKALGQVFKNMPYDAETFRIHALSKMWDHTAQLAVQKFGIKAAGFWTKAADTLKAAESLVFLRLNPAYAVNNFLNNEITGIARGVYNIMSPDDIIGYWDRVGVMHPRLRQGFGMGGTGVAAASEEAFGALLTAYGEASKTFIEARHISDGWLGKLGQKIKNISLPLDASKFAQDSERIASMRFMTKGMMEGMAHYWKPGKGYTAFGDWSSGLAERVGDDFARTIDNYVQSNPFGFADDITEAALNRTTLRAVEQAAETMGVPMEKIADVFGDDFVTKIDGVLGPAIQSGSPTRIRDSMALMRTNVRNHIDDWFKSADPTEILIDGPNGIARVWAEQSYHEFDMWNAHMTSLENEVPHIRTLAGDTRKAAWESLGARADAEWKNFFGWWEKRNKSMLDAIEERGFNVKFSDNRSLRDVVETAVADRTSTIQDFHKSKNMILRSVGDEPGAWEAAQDALDTLYGKFINDEIGSWKTLDGAIEPLVPERIRDVYVFQKEQIRNSRKAYMVWNKNFRRQANTLTNSAREELFATRYASDRTEMLELIYREDSIFRQAMAGDDNAMRYIRQQMGTPVEEGAQAVEQVAEGAEEVAQAAPALEIAPGQQMDMPFFPDQSRIIKPQPPKGIAESVTWYQDGGAIMDRIEESALRIAREKKVKLADLLPEDEALVLKYVDSVGEELKGARSAAMNFAEVRRDSALLNYTRRTEFDSSLGMVMPYAFWATHSIWNWAVYSLERPFVLSTYLKTRMMFEKAAGDKNIPQRLRGFGEFPRIKGPFYEDWMGEGIYVNPLRIGLPIETFMYPYERYTQQRQGQQTGAARFLEEMLADDEITSVEYQQAIQTQRGPAWNAAMKKASQGDDSWFEFAAMFTSPHAPLMWAYNKIKNPDEPWAPSAFMPITRNIKSITAYLGVGPPGGVNIEAGIRKQLGLPEFDEWDDYRVDRMLSNMAATNEITASEAIAAMIDRSGPMFTEAKRRAGKEFGLRGSFAMVGIPANIYPPGEEKSRELYALFGEAIDAYKDGDMEAYQNFFDKYPEARARLALFDGPEERARQFLKDEIWTRYNEMPSIHKSQVREALGEAFGQQFLQDQNYDAIDPETMAVWLRTMGGEPPGTISGNALPLELAPDEIAQKIQAFYDTRFGYFGEGIWDVQSKYFSLAEGSARRSYITQHPELKQYWDYKWDFMYRNPDTAPYLEEDPEKWPKYMSEGEIPTEPQLTEQELHTALGPRLYALFQDGEPYPAVLERRLEELGLAQ